MWPAIGWNARADQLLDSGITSRCTSPRRSRSISTSLLSESVSISVPMACGSSTDRPFTAIITSPRRRPTMSARSSRRSHFTRRPILPLRARTRVNRAPRQRLCREKLLLQPGVRKGWTSLVLDSGRRRGSHSTGFGIRPGRFLPGLGWRPDARKIGPLEHDPPKPLRAMQRHAIGADSGYGFTPGQAVLFSVEGSRTGRLDHRVSAPLGRREEPAEQIRGIASDRNRSPRAGRCRVAEHWEIPLPPSRVPGRLRYDTVGTGSRYPGGVVDRRIGDPQHERCRAPGEDHD